MRPPLLLALVVVGALLLIGTAAAVTENFQNGPGDVVKGSPNMYFPDGDVAIFSPTGYNDVFLASTSGGFHSAGFATPQQSNLFAFTYPSTISGTETTNIGVQLSVFDVYGSQIYNTNFVIPVNITSAASTSYALRVEAKRESQQLHVYANGIYVKNLGACVPQPYYWFTEVSPVDDLQVGSQAGGIVGVMPHGWWIAKDIADPSLSGEYDSTGNNVENDVFYVSYSITGDPTGATISIDGDHQIQAIAPPALNIQDVNGVWQMAVKSRAGITAFDMSEFMDAKEYGVHTITLTTAGGTVDEEFYYKGSATLETAIEWDREVYAPLDDVEIGSTIGTSHWFPGTYSYKGCIYDGTTGLFKENWTITTQTGVHSTSVTADIFPASGEYYTFLYAIGSAGQEILLDVDSTQIYTDKVVFSGTVWDAQQGTILQGATVSLTQSGTTYTDTTGSDGRFEFLNLAKDVLTQVSAAKSGYVTSWSNTTPTEYQRYEIEIALVPSAPAHTGEAVFGTVRSYPMGSFVESPTVRILHDGTEVNETVGTGKGFFIFDGLDAGETYTIEVEKEGFTDYSNAVVTGSGGSSLTQIDPWLIPNYDLTVYLVDAVNMQPITALMAVSVGGQSEQTSTGTAVFHEIQMGAASVAVVGSGYEANETTLSMYEDQEITLYVMPLAVVPTTEIPLTPTPTPALVGMIGTVYDGMTGQPITTATVEVSADQGAVTRTDTTDGNGDYDIQNIQNGVLTTVNATAAGYTHTAFSFTPAGSAEYIVDLYMYRVDESADPTIEPDSGRAGAGGTVLGGPFHELVETPTVVANNETWSGPATLSPDHVWYFTDLEPGGAYTFTASASGFVTRAVQATMGAADSFTVVPIVLDGVYDVTITIQDADTYALILQPVHLSLSNGQSGNTSTGGYTFTNLGYATYVVSATSEGYTGGGLSFLAYGTHTEYLYLAKAPEGSDSTYEYAIPPKPVEILARNIFGMPLSGVTVTAQGGETTLPDEDLLGAFFGWGDKYSGANLANATMTGTTSSDGGITFMMTDALKYNVTFSDPARGIDETVELMPHDTQYMFILGSMSATPAAGMPNMTLWADGAEGASPTLRGYYSDPAGTTSALYFIVERINGTVRTEVSNQSLGAVQTASPSFAVNHTTGAMYSWGFRATTPDRGALQQWNGITIHSRLVELPIEESMYFWVSMCLVFLFAGLFSGNNIKYGFVAFPMFCGVLWYIGWLNIAGMTLGIVMVLGILMYLAKVQVA